MASLTTEKKVTQLFLTTSEKLNGLDECYSINVGEISRINYEQYPVGGLVFSAGNMSIYANNYLGFNLYKICNIEDGNMLNIIYGYEVNELSSAMDTQLISDYSALRAQMMSGLEFNLLFGPLANTADNDYSYNQDSFDVYDYVELETAAKYFPYYDVEDKELDDMLIDDLYIFQGLIDSGADKIIVSDKSSSVVTGGDGLCCLSSGTTDFIRPRMGYDGFLISSNLSRIDEENADVRAIKAGMDLIYASDNFKSMYNEILSAVRLENALGRILSDKLG